MLSGRALGTHIVANLAQMLLLLGGCQVLSGGHSRYLLLRYCLIHHCVALDTARGVVGAEVADVCIAVRMMIHCLWLLLDM